MVDSASPASSDHDFGRYSVPLSRVPSAIGIFTPQVKSTSIGWRPGSSDPSCAKHGPARTTKSSTEKESREIIAESPGTSAENNNMRRNEEHTDTTRARNAGTGPRPSNAIQRDEPVRSMRPDSVIRISREKPTGSSLAV